jgi:hypothetical protein
MAEPLVPLLMSARSRWMIGGEPAGAAHPLAEGVAAAEAELRLLAVAGQYQRFVQVPQPPVLNLRPDLPGLSLPVLPDALRPLARRLLQDKGEAVLLARFVARRGHVLHPADWMPPPGADLPEVYHPWQQWQAGQAGPVAVLSADSWLDLSKAERLAQVQRMRATDPAGARAVVAGHLASCPAEERVVLVEAFATGLTEADAEFLQDLAQDRSEKVRKAAAHLLARLGRSDEDPRAAEVAAMFELATEGILRRRRVLRLIGKAKDGQLRSLVQTLPEITLPALAGALGLQPADLVELWDPEKVPTEVQHALSLLIARTGGEGEVAAWWRKLSAEREIARAGLPFLYPRLPAVDQDRACLWLVAEFGLLAGSDLLTLCGPAVPPPVSAALTAQRGGLVDQVRLAQDTTPDKAIAARGAASRLAALVSTLGHLLTAGDAALVLQTLTTAGVHPADPMLDRLTFNAALKGP